MAEHIPDREEAFALLTEYTESEALINHARTVEGVMRYMARKYSGDEDEWGLIGLVHDIDYERYPDEHCVKAPEILRERGWPEDWIRAVVSHGWGICSDVEPRTDLEKVLYAVDELTGLITATALVRPSRSVMEVEAKSVRKKMKDKAFARGVSREDVIDGAADLGVDLDEHISFVIRAMQGVAPSLGLAGI